jgi:hypothetical protein
VGTVIAYRNAEEIDRPFIVSTWSSSFRDQDSAGMIAMDTWADVMHAQIDRLLVRADVTTLVAYETDERKGCGHDLYGFIAGDAEPRPIKIDGAIHTLPVVFYCYTKQAYRRRFHIQRGLWRALGIDPEKPFAYACDTRAVTELAHKIPLARYTPKVARYPKSTNPTTPKQEIHRGR